MTRTRRSLALLGILTALMVATSLPASASFSASSAVSTMITTAVVAPPASVTVTARCRGINYNATVSWPASTSADVTGYRVVAYLTNGTTSLVGTTDAATLSLPVSTTTSTLSTYQPRITVTTLTSYGWTGESLPTAVLSC